MESYSDYICIVGAGPTGIFITHELLGRGKKVLLIESGNFQSESELLNYSNYYFETPSMLPQNIHRIGGGGNYWIGRIGEFRDLDFEKIVGVRNETWAFKKSQLEIYYRKCYESLLRTSVMDEEFINDNFQYSILLPKELRMRPIRYADPKVFNELLQDDLQNPNLTVMTDRVCLEISEDEETGSPVVKLQDILKKVVNITPRDVVVAAGTLQSTKLVLSSPKIMQNLSKGIVGHYLMEHLEDYVGTLTISEKNIKTLFDLSLNRDRKLNNNVPKDFGVALGIAECLSEQLSVLNISLEIIHLRTKYKFDPKDYQQKNQLLKASSKTLFLLERILRGSLNRVVSFVNSKILKRFKYSLWMKAEELPFSESRVAIDNLNPNTLIYNHKVSVETSNEVRKALEIIKELIEVNNLGHIEYYSEILKPNTILNMRPNWHPMGTLRIGNPTDSVVNENLLIHGTQHVYVLSPAVFPTGSNQNPVFTTLALALKLADRL